MLKDEQDEYEDLAAEVVDEIPEEKGVEELDEPEELDEGGGLADAEPLPNRILTDHFQLKEFHSKDRVAVPENTVDGLIALCRDILEPMRAKFGECEVNSGFRSEARNKAVGGARRSFHRYDLRPGNAAADVKFENGNSTQWFDEADRILGNAGGVGFYARFVHVDNRADKWRGQGG